MSKPERIGDIIPRVLAGLTSTHGGMMKLVVNKCYGGFGLSDAAVERYAVLKGLTLYPERSGKFASLTGPTWWLVPEEGRVRSLDGDDWKRATMEERRENNRLYAEQTLSPNEIQRDDPLLVRVVEELGDAAAGRFAELKVTEIPDDVEWEIEEYDGREWVAEKHRTW